MSFCTAAKILETSLKSARWALELQDLSHTVDNHHHAMSKTVSKVHMTFQTTAIALAIIEAFTSSNRRLDKAALKAAESISRIGSCAIGVFDFPENPTHQRMTELSQGFLAQLAGAFRNLCQAQANVEKYYLEMDPKDIENQTRPHCTEWDEDGCTKIEEKPVTIEECERNYKIAHRGNQALTTLETLIRSPIVGTIISRLFLGVFLGVEEDFLEIDREDNEAPINFNPIAAQRAERVNNHQQRDFQPIREVQEEAAFHEVPRNILQDLAGLFPIHARNPANNLHPIEGLDEENPFNFIQRDTIPMFLHEDRQLAQNICPISLLPIRHPASIRGEKQVYERVDLEESLNRNPSSPFTRAAVTVNDIIDLPLVQRQINHRLRYLETEITREVQRILAE